MAKKILFDIQSQSDIITNSSTEVFLLSNENGALEELIKTFLPRCNHWVKVFNTEEDVKKFLIEHFNPYDEDISSLSECLEFNPLLTINDSWNFDPVLMEKYGFTAEKIVDFFFEPYKELVGKAMLSFADDCGVPDEIWNFTDIARKNNLVEGFWRQ